MSHLSPFHKLAKIIILGQSPAVKWQSSMVPPPNKLRLTLSVWTPEEKTGEMEAFWQPSNPVSPMNISMKTIKLYIFHAPALGVRKFRVLKHKALI